MCLFHSFIAPFEKRLATWLLTILNAYKRHSLNLQTETFTWSYHFACVVNYLHSTYRI